jgi:type IV pilus assembly protein PilB
VVPPERAQPEALPPRQSRRFDASVAERRRLGDVLVDSGLITADQLQAALREQKGVDGPRRRIGQVVSDLGFASERDVAECLATLLNLELVDLSKMTVLPEHVRLLPRAVAERTRVLVLDRTERGVLTVAAADPTNVLAFDDVRLYTRSTDIEVFVATDSQIRDQINRAWSLSQDRGQVAEIVQEASAGSSDDEPEASAAPVAEEAPIVRFVNQVLGDAVRTRASDIHLEVERDKLRVRYRIDGLLRDVTQAPKRLATSVISRVKIISGLDIAERRIPQDGRTRFAVEGQAIDARISTLPSLHGEKVVIRLLTRGDAVPPLSDLGMEPEQLILLESALSVPQGLILITGPTGSGKTNTLYSAIATIRSPELNIVTLEDPVEVQLPGITQVGVSEKTGMTFSRGLRSILRQDPDIILVGEVRDSETAELALKAAMTGHLVLTTLHTNSAVAALTRLVDMGAEPFLVASSLTASVAQRLVRRPCSSCAEPYLPDELTLTMLGLVASDLAGASPRRGAGCQECGNTGYRGRTGVYEILTVDAVMRQVLMKDPSEAAISAQARASGMVTLRAAAIIKALRGQTTFEEAVRVTHADHAGGSSCPVCERPVESDMVACPWCAATLDRGQCQNCSRNLDADWRICPWCRTPAVRSLPQAPASMPQHAYPS